MATIITNRATVNYRNGAVASTAVSNTVSTTLQNSFSIQKSSLSDSYRVGETLTYIITVQNEGGNETGVITVTDNLGSYEFDGDTLTPLTFSGDAQLFINGVFDSVLTPEVNDNDIVFTLPSISSGNTATIVYSVEVNEYANGASDSVITNTATAEFDCDCPCNEPVSDSNTVTAEDFAELRVVKSLRPDPVVCGDELTYTIDILNYGNIPATEVVLTDTFVPPLTDLVVTVDGVLIPESDYDYVGGTLTLPNESGDTELVVPAATFVRNSESGAFEVTPGRLQVVITGNL